MRPEGHPALGPARPTPSPLGRSASSPEGGEIALDHAAVLGILDAVQRASHAPQALSSSREIARRMNRAASALLPPSR